MELATWVRDANRGALMRHGLIIALAAALLTTASWAPAPDANEKLAALALATERKTLPQPSTPRGSERVQPAPKARGSETTGTIPATPEPPGAAKTDSDARRVTTSVGRTLERMEEMFRPGAP
jgi:hypothetical protein